MRLLDVQPERRAGTQLDATERKAAPALGAERDRKSTRLNSSHANISYAVFCLKKKKQTTELQLGQSSRSSLLRANCSSAVLTAVGPSRHSISTYSAARSSSSRILLSSISHLWL